MHIFPLLPGTCELGYEEGNPPRSKGKPDYFFPGTSVSTYPVSTCNRNLIHTHTRIQRPRGGIPLIMPYKSAAIIM